VRRQPTFRFQSLQKGSQLYMSHVTVARC
jgi:hypothetical protein